MSPFARWFQARVLRKEAGEAELLLEVREEFLQGQGLVHGGILAALLDSALGQAVESLGAKVVTAELSVSYLRPVREGVLLARGWVVHPGRHLLHAAGEALLEGKRVAFAKGVLPGGVAAYTGSKGKGVAMFPSTMMEEELNLWDFLERAAALFGRKEVVSRLHTGEVHRTTYAEVYQRARRLKGGLKALGVGVGDRVATLGFLVEAIRGELKTVQHFVVMDEKAPEGYLAYEEALGEEADPVWVPERAACGMAYTTGTTGLPIPLVRLRVADEEGRPVPKDGKALGEVQLKGPWITGGYYGNEEATRSALTPDGFFRTGDIAVWDEEGYVEIKDRLKDLIKSGGEWISSVDLENALMGHPKVKEAAVVAIPHPKWQERPLAVVVPRGEKPTEEELREHLLRAGFAKWQLPDAFVFVEEIPRTSAGKFLKRALREQYKDLFQGGG